MNNKISEAIQYFGEDPVKNKNDTMRIFSTLQLSIGVVGT